MNFRKYAGIILNILVPLLTVYLVCVWGLRLVVFFLPFVIGWIVAAIANPVVRFFEKRLKIVRRHGSMVLIAGVLALVIFGIYALFSWVFREMTEFGQALPGIYASIREEVDLACERIGGLLKYLPADTETTIISELENVGGYIGDFVQKIAASAGSRVVRTLPEVFVNTIIVFLSSYLFLADHDKLVETVRKVMPGPVIKYGRMMKNDIRTLIGGYFLAQFKIMFVVAVVLVDRNVIPQGSIWNFSWNRDRDSGFSADVRHRNGIDSLGSGETLYRGVRLCAQPCHSLCFNTGHPSGDPAEDRR